MLDIIMIHTSAYYVVKDIGSSNFWVGNICDAVSRVGVPLFVMISGALLLDENYSFSMEKNTKRIVKMIRFFVFWSAVYCVFFQVISRLVFHDTIKVKRVVAALLQGNYHLWFVYMIIGIYLILPLLRLWVKKENI